MVEKIVNVRQLREIIEGKYTFSRQKKIKYFDTYDLTDRYLSDFEKQHNFYAICYDEKTIYGISSFQIYDYDKESFSISYLSVNKDHQGKGISKNLVKLIIKFIIDNYPNNKLRWSEWSVDGWKYLRKTLLTECKKYKISYIDNKVGYPSNGANSEFYKLVKESENY